MSALVYIQSVIVPAALSMLPKKMDTQPARAMLLAIGLQESRFEARTQIGGGPARGFWQFEMNGGVRGVLLHKASRTHIQGVLETLQYATSPLVSYDAIADNDVLACVFARLLLWTLPGALPVEGQYEYSWDSYLEAWRPGKPHRETWNAFYDEAWA